MTEHLDPVALDRYLSGVIAPDERARLEAHLAECAECRLELVEVRRILATAPSHRRRVLIPLAAAAAALLLLWTGTVWRAPQSSPTRDNEAPSTYASAPQPIAPLGNVPEPDRLVWSAVPGASRYRVTLFTSEGQPAWQATTPDTFVTLPDTLHLAAETQQYWQVKAEAAFGRWIESELVAFIITRAGTHP